MTGISLHVINFLYHVITSRIYYLKIKESFTLITAKLINYYVHCNCFTMLSWCNQIQEAGVTGLHNNSEYDYKTHDRDNSFFVIS